MFSVSNIFQRIFIGYNYLYVTYKSRVKNVKMQPINILFTIAHCCIKYKKRRPVNNRSSLQECRIGSFRRKSEFVELHEMESALFHENRIYVLANMFLLKLNVIENGINYRTMIYFLRLK